MRQDIAMMLAAAMTIVPESAKLFEPAYVRSIPTMKDIKDGIDAKEKAEAKRNRKNAKRLSLKDK